MEDFLRSSMFSQCANDSISLYSLLCSVFKRHFVNVPMNDEKQESEKSISSSKLSATVPAFVPGIAYTGPTSPSNLVINSNLSPLVPEFKPSVALTSYTFPPYEPVHNLHYQYHGKQLYVARQENIEQQNAPFQAYQTSFSQSKKSTKTGKGVATKKIEGNNNEGQNSGENTTGENLTDTDSTVITKKKKRRRKKKEPNDLTQQGQEELNTEGFTEAKKELTLTSVKDDASQTKHEHASSKSNRQSSSLEQNSTTLHSSLNSSSENAKDSETNIGVTAVESFGSPDEQCNKKQHTTPTFTVSYSDKVKSLASKNNSSHKLATEKSWEKDFSPDSSSVKDKHNQDSQFDAGQGTLANNLNHGDIRELKGGRRTGEERGYNRLKDGEPSKSQTRKVEQIPRTGKQMGRNNSFKKMTCDDDDNWRLKRDDAKVVDSTDSSRTEALKKWDIKNLNNEPLKKRPYQAEVDVDSRKFDKGGKHEKSVGHIVIDVVGKSSKKQQNSCEFSSGSNTNEACSKLPSSDSDLQSGSQRTDDQTNTLSVAPSNSRILEGEFPDLRDSVKIKRPSAVDKRTVNHQEMTSPPKPSAPMSYSAVLQTAPRPKPVAVSPAWESEHPTKHRGLLRVPLQATADGVENEAGTEGAKQKKKKKKKKKKTKESGDKPQENATPKRTEKPIQFDLGVMLQTISNTGPDRKQSGKKHVIATGVLPSQLSAASTSEVKPSVKNVQLLKKAESKVPHNVLDSTAPVIKRGKERETPARKKPSALKKIILKEREEKKKAREGETGEDDKENEICSGEDDRTCEPEVESIVQEEMQSPLEDDSASPEPSSPTDKEIAAKIHSRKFREYCFQVPDKEVDSVATDLLRELVRFQDRQFHKDPVKAKVKRRFVLGLREVSKHLKLRKLKCVIISSNVERIKSAGGLDETLSGIITTCQENQIPLVFALKRQLLGKVLLKKVPVSIVGIFNYDGAQEHFKKLIDLTQKTRQAYSEKWEEIREKLELQQKENQITAETDKAMGADGEDTEELSYGITGEGATIENHHPEPTESSDDEEEKNSDDRHNETDAAIIENDLEIQEF
ncbi:hypothetical protein ACROYT_G007779 [Oculina patagonica]